MNKFKLIILTLSLSCCLTTLVQPSAQAQSSDGKDIVIKGLPKINRSVAQSIADQLGLGNIFSGVLDFFAGIEKANDRTLDVQTPDWNVVKDTIDSNDTRAKELGRQIEDRTTDSWLINQDESEEVQRALIQDAISTSTTSTEAQETAAATLVEIEAVLQKSGALSKNSAETDVSQQILQNMSEQTGINTQLLGVIASQNVQFQKDRAFSVSLQIQAARQNSIANKLLAECQVLQANESLACLEKQIPEIEEIVKQAELQDPIANSPAGKYARGVLDYLKDLASNAASGNGLKAASLAVNNVFFGNPFIMGAIKLVFGGIQLAFNFALETASILHALLLPLVISTIFTPLGPKYTETWIQGYVQLVSIKFLYIALIGLTAQAIVVSQAQFATGIAFLIFSSVMGPMVAFLMAKGGGANLAKFVASSTTSALSNTVQGATTLATGGAGGIGSLVGKGLFKAGSKGLARRTTQRSS